MRIIGLCLFILCCSCAEPASTVDKVIEQGEKKRQKLDFGTFAPISFSEVHVDPGNDSLWYHLVLDIPGSQLLAVAQPTNEANRQGIRMQVLSMNADSTFVCHTQSSPGYDSSKLFPTCYKDDKGNVIILADTGERESWGQKVYLLKGGEFSDLGFIDVGTADFTLDSESGEKEMTPQSIAPYVRIDSGKKGLEFRFDTDEILLFDDGKGNQNVVVDGKVWYYSLNKKGKWSLKES